MPLAVSIRAFTSSLKLFTAGLPTPGVSVLHVWLRTHYVSVLQCRTRRGRRWASLTRVLIRSRYIERCRNSRGAEGFGGMVEWVLRMNGAPASR